MQIKIRFDFHFINCGILVKGKSGIFKSISTAKIVQQPFNQVAEICKERRFAGVQKLYTMLRDAESEFKFAKFANDCKACSRVPDSLQFLGPGRRAFQFRCGHGAHRTRDLLLACDSNNSTPVVMKKNTVKARAVELPEDHWPPARLGRSAHRLAAPRTLS